jgi:hypothetical protein
MNLEEISRGDKKYAAAVPNISMISTCGDTLVVLRQEKAREPSRKRRGTYV